MFYVSNAKETRNHNAFDRIVVTLSTPVQWLTVTVLDGVTRFWQRYIYLVGVQQENERLRQDNGELKAEVLRREEDRLENERLSLLLGLRARAPQVPDISAHVIATSPTPQFRAVRIDRGSRHGVELGAAVVVHDGVVGRVAAVTAFSADVMLIVDANSSLDVLVQRTRARGRARGKGGDRSLVLQVEYLARTEDVEPGDRLITSGTGAVFPKGLLVGSVVSVERGAFGLYQHAVAEPSVDFGRLEEVLVIPRGWPADATFEPTGAAAPQAADEVGPPAAAEPKAEVRP